MRKILTTRLFNKALKKLHSNQKIDLDKAIMVIAKTPEIGERKVGDLDCVFVYKFKMNNQLVLLAYTVEQSSITLLAFGPHENFYRDIKKH